MKTGQTQIFGVMKKIPVRSKHIPAWHRPPESSRAGSRKERERVTAQRKGLVRRNGQYFMDNTSSVWNKVFS